MKKAEKVLYTVFKVIYFVSNIAAFAVYFADLFDPDAVYCRVTSSDWTALLIMSCAYLLINEREKQCKAQQTIIAE